LEGKRWESGKVKGGKVGRWKEEAVLPWFGIRREAGGKVGKWERGKSGWGELLCPGEDKGL
jgi:hypothetical protein